MPCFENLFPKPYDDSIQDLLFSMAAFHGFAKMRMHTDMSLLVFDGLTSILGKTARYFANIVCKALPAHATPKEAAAKARRKAQRKAHTKTSKTQSKQAHSRGKGRASKKSDDDEQEEEEDCRSFNLFTFKWHTLTHYVPII
jgi:hypothetical protein